MKYANDNKNIELPIGIVNFLMEIQKNTICQSSEPTISFRSALLVSDDDCAIKTHFGNST